MRRAPRTLATVAALLALAGCSQGHASSTTTSTSPSADCLGVTIADVAAATRSTAAVTPQRLAPAPGSAVACGTAFVDGAGQLVVELRELSGGQPLADFRSEVAADAGAAQLRSAPSLGTAAFVAPTAVGFPLGHDAVALRAGFDASGRPQLSSDQLVQLATFIRQHRGG